MGSVEEAGKNYVRACGVGQAAVLDLLRPMDAERRRLEARLAARREGRLGCSRHQQGHQWRRFDVICGRVEWMVRLASDRTHWHGNGKANIAGSSLQPM